MIDGLKPYPEYKDSGVPWLGAVPGHWVIKRVKNWVSINACTLSERTQGDFEFSYVDIGSVETGRFSKTPIKIRFSAAPSRARRVLCPGDTIVSTVRTYLKAVVTIGTIGHSMVASTGFAILTPRRDTAPKCLGYVALSDYFTNQITRESVGIAYPAISETKLANIPITLPPADEQVAIVRFLDQANRRIEKAIRAKRKMIALLNEQKQVIIHRAVTRGLDPDVPLKDSSIPWLREIPAHWEVMRCKYLFREVDTRSETGLEQHLSMSQRLGLVPSHLVENRTLVSESYKGGKLCLVGDMVLNRLKAHLGVFAIAQHDGIISPDYTVLRPVEARGCAYFEYLLKSPGCRGELRIRAKGIVEGFWRLYTDDFYDIYLPKPPLEEQLAIIESNQIATADIVKAVDRTEREISLLREYRTRLIADVVTGKLDVREVATKLPDEVEPVAEMMDTPNEDSFDEESTEVDG